MDLLIVDMDGQRLDCQICISLKPVPSSRFSPFFTPISAHGRSFGIILHWKCWGQLHSKNITFMEVFENAGMARVKIHDNSSQILSPDGANSTFDELVLIEWSYFLRVEEGHNVIPIFSYVLLDFEEIVFRTKIRQLLSATSTQSHYQILYKDISTIISVFGLIEILSLCNCSSVRLNDAVYSGYFFLRYL